MKAYALLAVLFILVSVSAAQTLKGLIISKSSGESLEYVSIGILGTNRGTVSDHKGYFSLDVKDLSLNEKVRFSMIGFKAQELSVKELLKNDLVIQLENDLIHLEEITVKPKELKIKDIGTNATSKNIATGWGSVGTGGERGLKVKVKEPIFVENLNFHVSNNGYDSVLFRVHVRQLKENHPGKELLTDNILIIVSQKEGWVELDLSKYNLYYEEDIAVTLEWVRAWGKCFDDCLLFSMSMIKGTLYAKEASESSWEIKNMKSPAIYLKVYH